MSMLTDEEIAALQDADPLVFARAVEAAVRKTCEVACEQALRHARSDEADRCGRRVDDLRSELIVSQARYYALLEEIARGRQRQPMPLVIVPVSRGDGSAA